MIGPGLLYTGLLYVGLVSLVMTALILVTFRWNPEIWVHDAPPKIRERYGPVSAKAKRDGQLASIPTFLLLAGVLILAIMDVYRRAGGALRYWDVFVVVFVALQTFNVFDLVVIDWLVVATLRPKQLLLPGTETWEGYADYGFYLQGFLKGLVGITAASLLFAGGAVLVARLAA